MTNISVADIINLIKDYSRNSNLDSSKAIRAINSACDFVFNQLGLPCQERSYNFYFFDDQNEYELPIDFGEAISLRYYDNKYNEKRFLMYPPQYVYEKIYNATYDTKLFSVDYSIGKLLVVALNNIASLPLDNFDSGNSQKWTAENDASNIVDDKNVKIEGLGSLSFTITPSTTKRATLKKSGVVYNFYSYENIGHFRLYVYLPSITGLTSLSINFGNSISNYYKIVATRQSNGNSFSTGWNLIDFSFENAILIGSPDIQNITSLWIDFDYNESFTGGTNFRLDDLKIIVPDEMVLTYYTKYKGQDVNGNNLENFTNDTDKLFLGNVDVGLINLIALQASFLIKPQLLQEIDWIMKKYDEFLDVYRRKYPRKRANNLLTIPKLPNTN